MKNLNSAVVFEYNTYGCRSDLLLATAELFDGGVQNLGKRLHLLARLVDHILGLFHLRDALVDELRQAAGGDMPSPPDNVIA